MRDRELFSNLLRSLWENILDCRWSTYQDEKAWRSKLKLSKDGYDYFDHVAEAVIWHFKIIYRWCRGYDEMHDNDTAHGASWR